MTSDNNPWSGMLESSQRRVDSQTEHDLFWITDLQGNYGFCLKTKKLIEKLDASISLKGITVVKRNSKSGFAELFLILSHKEDWQIFHTLCRDLISTVCKYKSDEQMINAVEVRLKKWQQLLKQSSNKEMPLELQMGLFSELVCLKNIIAPKVGIKQAVFSWVGPEKDKQDFLLNNSAVEVKSYRTSKGAVASISSLQQLYSEKKLLYLSTYGLTVSDQGFSIKDIVKDISRLIENQSVEMLELFEMKLLEYGYMPELIKDHFYNFVIDKQKVFKVTDNFPKLDINNLKEGIISVKYSIDLSMCSDFEVDLDLLTL